jgi:hypothetical protein
LVRVWILSSSLYPPPPLCTELIVEICIHAAFVYI